MIFHRGQSEPPPLPFDTIPERLGRGSPPIRGDTSGRAREERRNGLFAGLSTFDWYKLPPWRLEVLKTKNARKIWIYPKKSVTLHRVSYRALTE